MHQIQGWLAWLVVACTIVLAVALRVWVWPDHSNVAWIAIGIVAFGLGGFLLGGSEQDGNEPESHPDPE